MFPTDYTINFKIYGVLKWDFSIFRRAHASDNNY